MPDRCGTNAACSTIAPTRLSSAQLGVTVVPNRRATPLVGRSSPVIIRSVVDFPAPFGPSNP